MDNAYLLQKLDEIARTARHLDAKMRFIVEGTFDNDELEHLKMILEQIKLDCESILTK